MALRNPGCPGKVELTVVSPTSPRSQNVAELVAAHYIGHVVTVEHELDDGDYLPGNQ